MTSRSTEQTPLPHSRWMANASHICNYVSAANESLEDSVEPCSQLNADKVDNDCFSSPAFHYYVCLVGYDIILYVSVCKE